MGKIGLAICVLAAVVLYGTTLFWLAVAATVIRFSIGSAIPIILAKPEMKRFKETVKQMELDGATNEEIEEFMNCPTEPYDCPVPKWLSAIGWVAQIAGVILLVTGLVIRF